MTKSTYRRVCVIVVLSTTALVSSVSANHSWNGYHWARTTSSFNLTVVDSTTSDWDGNVAGATQDWSVSQKLDMVTDNSGSTTDFDRRKCVTVSGKVHVCNHTYGNNQWLGLAGVSIDTNGHIVTAYVKLNDSYLSPGSYYYTWRQSVLCQELGHTLGLDHQDENFYNDPLYTCMDYQDPPWDSPNQHDYDELDIIYSHTDTYDSYAGSSSGGGGCGAPAGKGCNKAGIEFGNSPADWGLSLGRHGNEEQFIRIDPDGTRHITFVTWASGR